jgi:hypothetical protein
MFRHQAAILGQFIINKGSLHPTRTSDASHPNFHHKIKNLKLLEFRLHQLTSTVHIAVLTPPYKTNIFI